MKSTQQPQGAIATIVSAVTLLLSSTTVLAALEEALEPIWRSATPIPTGMRGWVRTRFLSLALILTLGFLLLISFTLSTALSAVRDKIVARHSGLVGALGVLDLLFSLALVSTLFALIFRYMPARRLPWKTVAVGGALTAVLFDIGRWAVSLYLAHSTQPSAFGAAASFAALLLWLYYTSLIFLFGAEFTSYLGGLRNDSKASHT